MAHVYISHNPPPGDVRRCEQSQERRERITITDATENGKVKAFAGVVQAIESFPDALSGRQHRVTILDD